MIDLTNHSKQFVTVILPNGEKVFVVSPKKRQINALIATQQDPSVDNLYQVAAELLSNNKQGKTFSVVQLDDWSIEDVRLFFSEYMRFVLGIKDDPNVKSPACRIPEQTGAQVAMSSEHTVKSW